MLVELLAPLPAGLLLLAVALAAGTLRFDLPPAPPAVAPAPRRRVWLAGGLLALLVLGWILASGMGGFAYCRYDYLKHWVMFQELYQQRLPALVTDPRDQSQQLLHYYFAYYITPVRLAQVTAGFWSALDLDIVIVAGYSLAAVGALRLLARLAAVPPLALFCIIVVLGGFDAAGFVVFGVEPVYEPLVAERILVVINFEWWGATFAPQAFTSHLYWAPQHFFAALLGLPLLLAALRAPGGPARALLRAALLLVAAALWSPYVAVGLALVGAAELLLRRRDGPLAGFLAGGWQAIFCREWRLAAAVAVFGAPTLLYLAASRALEPPRLLLSEVPFGDWIVTFLLNHAPFLAAAAVALWAGRRRGGAATWRPAAQVLLCGLLLEALLLCVAHGLYNDWGMRTTLPVLLWMTLPLCRLLVGQLAISLKALLLLAVGLSSASAVMEIARGLAIGGPCAPYGTYGFEALSAFPDQYLADGDSLFYRHLAR